MTERQFEPRLDLPQASQLAVQALLNVIERSTTPEMIQSRQILARRLALTGAVVSSRLPAPRNITEVGGYINLLSRQGDQDTLEQLIAAILGVAGPVRPDAGDPLAMPPRVAFSELPNQRPPAGPGLAATPLSLAVRSDFRPALEDALTTIARVGCVLPLVRIPARLPGIGQPVPRDLLALLGRAVMVVPATALSGSNDDAVVLARPAPGGTASGSPGVFLRQLDAGAPDGGSLSSATVSVAGPDGSGVIVESVANLTLFDPTPALAAAGWIFPNPVQIRDLPRDSSWARLENTTGLIPGVTRLQDELLDLNAEGALLNSGVRSLFDLVWDGRGFVAG